MAQETFPKNIEVYSKHGPLTIKFNLMNVLRYVLAETISDREIRGVHPFYFERLGYDERSSSIIFQVLFMTGAIHEKYKNELHLMEISDYGMELYNWYIGKDSESEITLDVKPFSKMPKKHTEELKGILKKTKEVTEKDGGKFNFTEISVLDFSSK